MSNVLAVSIYMDNIPHEMRMAQAEVFDAIGGHIDFRQIKTRLDHPKAIDAVLTSACITHDYVLLFDIDAIPLSRKALDFLIDKTYAGGLVGVMQRANHLQNGGHLYAGPCVLGISTHTYQLLGIPSAVQTARADVGEELTYAAEEAGCPVTLIRPARTQEPPRWYLDSDRPEFGIGTFYAHQGEEMFYHLFESRSGQKTNLFLDVCRNVLVNNLDADGGPL